MKKVTKQEIEKLLSARFSEGFLKLSSIPQPNTFKDMKKASKRIKEAIIKGEKIAVVGDYDVDGVIASVILKEFFEKIGYPLQLFIPNRFIHGYGLSVQVIEELGDVDLIITVDNGIGAIKAAQRCQEKGIDLIITDHHTPQEELPEAFAIINPKQQECDFKYSEICGAQVAWFLVGELKKELGINLEMKQFLDLLSLAIIADVMPLRHINRPLVKSGLKMLQESQRSAIKILKTDLKKEVFSSEDIAFGIAPILNSAGRMEDAMLAVDFLSSKDFFEASVYYARLLSLNTKRKQEERRVLEASLNSFYDGKVILSVGEDWNEGVLGIVAAKLSDRFKKPAIVLTKTKEGYYKGSGRSVGDIDLYTLLEQNQHYLLGFGGHKKAAGLSLEKENIEKLHKNLNSQLAKTPTKETIVDSTILGELPFYEIDWELIDIIERFAPYGEGNPTPTFLASKVKVKEQRWVGEYKNHLLLTLEQEGITFKGIYFNCSKEPKGEYADLIFQPIKNFYNNKAFIQLFITNIL